MVFTRFVEIGRVVLINGGAEDGKLAVIVNVIDQNRALIDGPSTGVRRQPINFRRLALTDFTVKVGVAAGTQKVGKEFDAAGVAAKWAATAWGKKLDQRRRRAKLSDFDRFKVSLARKQRAKIINTEVNVLRKAVAAANKKK